MQVDNMDRNVYVVSGVALYVIYVERKMLIE